MTAPAKHTPGFGRRLFVKGGPLNGAWVECEAPHAEWLVEAEKRLAAPDLAARVAELEAALREMEAQRDALWGALQLADARLCLDGTDSPLGATIRAALARTRDGGKDGAK